MTAVPLTWQLMPLAYGYLVALVEFRLQSLVLESRVSACLFYVLVLDTPVIMSVISPRLVFQNFSGCKVLEVLNQIPIQDRSSNMEYFFSTVLMLSECQVKTLLMLASWTKQPTDRRLKESSGYSVLLTTFL